MPHLFTCPHCQMRTEVEDRYSGQTGQCVSCGGDIQLPEFATPAPQTVAARRRSYHWIVATVVAFILLGCLVYAGLRLGGNTVGRLTAGRERSSSIKNLQQIASAMNAYAADHGTYPPPVTRAADGSPLHSWRVLLLPYLGEEELFNEFKLEIPWNDPDNMRVANRVPSVYRHPSGRSSGLLNESAYYLITGSGTLFPPSGPLGPQDVVDSPGQTILLTEGTPLVPSGSWIEPIDLEMVKMSGEIGSRPGVDPGGLLDGGAAIVTVDERGHFVPDSINSTTFRALITPAGGERLPDDTLN